MAWTTPKTNWATGELVTAADLNAIGENLAALKNPSTAAYTSTADITESIRTEFEDVDSKFNLTLTTAGGDVVVHFHGSLDYADRRFDVEVDGSRLGDVENGIYRSHIDPGFVCFTHLIQELSAGSHTFKLQSKGRSIRTLRASAQFWVREI